MNIVLYNENGDIVTSKAINIEAGDTIYDIVQKMNTNSDDNDNNDDTDDFNDLFEATYDRKSWAVFYTP